MLGRRGLGAGGGEGAGRGRGRGGASAKTGAAVALGSGSGLQRSILAAAATAGCCTWSGKASLVCPAGVCSASSPSRPQAACSASRALRALGKRHRICFAPLPYLLPLRRPFLKLPNQAVPKCASGASRVTLTLLTTELSLTLRPPSRDLPVQSPSQLGTGRVEGRAGKGGMQRFLLKLDVFSSQREYLSGVVLGTEAAS